MSEETRNNLNSDSFNANSDSFDPNRDSLIDDEDAAPSAKDCTTPILCARTAAS